MMPPIRPARAHLLALALVASVLAGCPGTQDPETRLYVLGALPADTAPLPGAKRTPPLVVDLAPLGFPQYLDRPQIVTRVEPNRVAISEYAQWAGSLPREATRVLATDLARLLATPEVHFLGRSAPPADARVEIEVMQFERGPDGRVVLAAQWRVLGARDEAPRAAAFEQLASAPLAAESGAGATVAAMSDLLGRLARIVAGAVLAHAGR